jgi:hypothetical protein
MLAPHTRAKAILAALSLSACGGGGSSSSTPAIYATPTPSVAIATPAPTVSTPTPAPNVSTPTPSPTTSPTYSPVGSYAGSTLNSAVGSAGTGVITILINSDGSGQFGVQFPNHTPVSNVWPASLGHISGANIEESGPFTLNGVATGCEFTLNANAVSSNELDGSYSLSGTSCPQTGTVNFNAVRAL